MAKFVYFPDAEFLDLKEKKIDSLHHWLLFRCSNQKDGEELNTTDSFFKSQDSMFGDMSAAPTATAAMTAKVKLFMHPWPRDTLPKIPLQYLSASLRSA